MGDEVAIVVGERDRELRGLALERLEGERDVAEMQPRLLMASVAALAERGDAVRDRLYSREGEHVGRTVDPAPARIERTQGRVVGEAEADLGALVEARFALRRGGDDGLARDRPRARQSAPQARGHGDLERNVHLAAAGASSRPARP